MNFKAIKAAVAQSRSTAFKDAKRHGRFVHSNFVRSRGTFLATSNKTEGQCEPYPEADCPEWDGTKKQIVDTVDRVLSGYPEVEEIYAAGAYDIAETIDFDDYEPRVAEWSVVIWTSAEGYLDVPRISNDEATETHALDRFGNIIASSRTN